MDHETESSDERDSNDAFSSESSSEEVIISCVIRNSLKCLIFVFLC